MFLLTRMAPLLARLEIPYHPPAKHLGVLNSSKIYGFYHGLADHGLETSWSEGIEEQPPKGSSHWGQMFSALPVDLFGFTFCI